MASWPPIAKRIRVPLGFVLAALYVWLAKPSLIAMLGGTAFIIAGLVVRGLASGHLEKNERLTAAGPYAYTRNPLYLGSLIMAAGFAIAARSLPIVAILVIMFAAIYQPVIRAEEAFLAQRFPEFADYARRVPRLVPRLRSSGGQQGSFSWDLYWKHREYNATLGSVAIMAILVSKLLWSSR